MKRTGFIGRPDREAKAAKKARAQAKRELDRGLKALRAGSEEPASDERITPEAVAILREEDLHVAPGGAITLAQVKVALAEPAHRGPRAPLAVRVVRPFEWRDRRVTSPTWLRIIRAMPCAMCGKGIPFAQAWSAGVSQSEANHYPGRGRAGGGSDFETHPACGGPNGCHREITEHRISDERQARAVADALRLAFSAFRAGILSPSVILAVALEVVIDL